MSCLRISLPRSLFRSRAIERCAIDGQIVGRDFIDKRWTKLTRIIAAIRPFDLDDVCPHVAQVHGAEWASEYSKSVPSIPSTGHRAAYSFSYHHFWYVFYSAITSKDWLESLESIFFNLNEELAIVALCLNDPPNCTQNLADIAGATARCPPLTEQALSAISRPHARRGLKLFRYLQSVIKT